QEPDSPHNTQEAKGLDLASVEFQEFDLTKSNLELLADRMQELAESVTDEASAAVRLLVNEIAKPVIIQDSPCVQYGLSVEQGLRFKISPEVLFDADGKSIISISHFKLELSKIYPDNSSFDSFQIESSDLSAVAKLKEYSIRLLRSYLAKDGLHTAPADKICKAILRKAKELKISVAPSYQPTKIEVLKEMKKADNLVIIVQQPGEGYFKEGNNAAGMLVKLDSHEGRLYIREDENWKDPIKRKRLAELISSRPKAFGKCQHIFLPVQIKVDPENPRYLDSFFAEIYDFAEALRFAYGNLKITIFPIDQRVNEHYLYVNWKTNQSHNTFSASRSDGHLAA
ncbi:MAG: hypothetical protein KDD56_06100, partial [Bdellovibrionales bacterium]|nr:hypothetical protein [Bdellovibrionales bacterium]